MQIISVVLHLHKNLSDILQETKFLEHLETLFLVKYASYLQAIG